MDTRLTGLLIVLLMFSCQNQADVEETSGGTGVVLIDTETAETYKLALVDAYPATNPKTGKKTLMPALYCPSCGKWYAVPPPEEMQRSPESRKCPKDGGPLLLDGPIE